PGLVHARGNVEEMLDELDDHVFVGGIVLDDLHRELEHVLREQRHPCRAVRLLQMASGGKRGTAVEDPDVVEAEEPSFEDVLAEAVLAVHPPREVQRELLERRLEEVDVYLTAEGLLRAMQKERRPGVYGRVHIAEVPLVSGKLAVGMEIPPQQ